MSRDPNDDTIWGFDEELLVPVGDGVRLRVVADHPWFLIAWEPIPLTLPGPPTTRPWVWGMTDVEFHLWPYEVIDGGHALRSHGSFKSAFWFTSFWTVNDIDYQYGGGRVIWRVDAWWFRHWARR